MAMNRRAEYKAFLLEYLQARHLLPRLAQHAEDRARQSLDYLGGMAGAWRADYSLCTYHSPCRVMGELVDLSAIEKIDGHYARIQVTG